jgi:hypothetical protein
MFICLDAHLYPNLLYNVNDLDTFTIGIGRSGENNLCECMYASEYLPKLCKQLELYRRDPKNAKTYGWDIRKFAIITNETNETK